MARRPGYAQFMLHTYRRDEHPILILQQAERIISDQNAEVIQTVTMEGPKPRVVAAQLNMVSRSHLTFLMEANGYRKVSWDEFADRAIYARGWAWPLLKIARAWHVAVWSTLRWLRGRNLIVCITHESMVPRLRDIRPSHLGWRHHGHE